MLRDLRNGQLTTTDGEGGPTIREDFRPARCPQPERKGNNMQEYHNAATAQTPVEELVIAHFDGLPNPTKRTVERFNRFLFDISDNITGDRLDKTVQLEPESEDNPPFIRLIQRIYETARNGNPKYAQTLITRAIETADTVAEALETLEAEALAAEPPATPFDGLASDAFNASHVAMGKAAEFANPSDYCERTVELARLQLRVSLQVMDFDERRLNLVAKLKDALPETLTALDKLLDKRAASKRRAEPKKVLPFKQRQRR